MTNVRRMMMAAAAGAGGETAYRLYSWGYRARRPSPPTFGSGPLRLAAEPGNWTKVSSTETGGFAITDSGELFGWGYGAAGRGGWGNTTNYNGQTDTTYKQIGALTTWADVGGAGYSSAAIKTDGTLWTWGEGGLGELGTGSTTDVSSPVQVGSLTNWSKVSQCPARNEALGAVKTDGTLWTWGSGGYGRLGHGNTTNISSPAQVGALTDWSQITGGENGWMTALKTDGTLWSWGNNRFGNLGHGTSSSSGRVCSPVQIGSLTTWAFVGGGGNMCGAVKTDGTLWTWGYNHVGQLGLGDTTNICSPVQVGSLTNWAEVRGGYNWMMGLKTDNTLWGWGRSGYNAVNGTGTGSGANLANLSSPVQIGSDTDWRVLAPADALKGEEL